MPQFAVEFHPLAADEAGTAERWYRKRNEMAAARFQRELDRVVELLSERPEAAPPYIGNTRRFLLRRFPFFVVYRVDAAHPSHRRCTCAAEARLLGSALRCIHGQRLRDHLRTTGF